MDRDPLRLDAYECVRRMTANHPPVPALLLEVGDRFLHVLGVRRRCLNMIDDLTDVQAFGLETFSDER